MISTILLMMPVSAASTECSFSFLEGLNAYLMNTETDKGLSGLAMNFDHDIGET